MARSRTVIIAGGGIGGLTAALALARRGLRVVVAEQAERLEETGAGIQLSPNATRVLRGLGVTERLRSVIVAPKAVRVRTWRGRDVAEVPLGSFAENRYGAPYWVARRADVQAALMDAVAANSDITLRLHTRVEDHAVHANGITVHLRTAAGSDHEHGIALIGADGLWSGVRARLGDRSAPRFARRTAWRAVLPTRPLVPEFRDQTVSLWLGPDAHLVFYPVHAGAALNIVATVRDEWEGPGWSASGTREELLAHYRDWPPLVRNLLALPDRWLKWALYDHRRLRHWGQGPVALLGDAAHPMLPFLAQGAAMAIEDAYVLAEQLGGLPDQPDRALRRYERARERRTARVQRTARANGRTYHLKGLRALARNFVLRRRSGKSLLRRYDWLYGWEP